MLVTTTTTAAAAAAATKPRSNAPSGQTPLPVTDTGYSVLTALVQQKLVT